MPGIIVSIDPDSSSFYENREIVKNMAHRSCFENFYRVNLFENEKFGLNAAIIHFKNIPLSQVICHEPCFCLFSGELFLTGELKDYANKNDITLKLPESSAQFVSQIYKKGGYESLSLLNGIFTLLLIDHNDNSLVLMNDRHGMHKWYYTNFQNGAKLFSPDVISFHVHPKLTLTEDLKAVAQKFKYGCILEGRSLYNEIKKLPNATSLKYHERSWSKNEYWKPEDLEQKPKPGVNDFIDKASSAFFDITQQYFTEDKTGMSLTGGWDTRCIVAVLSKKGISMPAYTFRGCYKDCYDVKIAREIAAQKKWPYHLLELNSKFLNDIDTWLKKASIVSDGLASLNTCHEYYLNSLAREIAPIRLTGKYGSQIIRGVTMLKDRSPDFNIFNDEFRDFYTSQTTIFKTTSRSSLIRYEMPQFFAGIQYQEQAVLNVRTPYLDNVLVELMLQAPDINDNTQLQKNIILRYDPVLGTIMTNRGEFTTASILKSVMHTFYKSVNFCDMVYNWESLPKYAKTCCDILGLTWLPRIVLGKKEWIHYRLWIQNELKDYVCSILTDSKTLNRSLYNKRYIRKIVDTHFKLTGGNFTSEIIKIIGHERWFRAVEEKKTEYVVELGTETARTTTTLCSTPDNGGGK